jgi:hypothetical protein
MRRRTGIPAVIRPVIRGSCVAAHGAQFTSTASSTCEPLTVRDACSRKVLAVTLLARPSTSHVKRVLLDLFERHGLLQSSETMARRSCACARGAG